jgi:phenylalanine-4-hydroxylase
VYFVIESFDELFHLLQKDLIKMAQDSFLMADYPAKFEKKIKNKKK